MPYDDERHQVVLGSHQVTRIQVADDPETPITSAHVGDLINVRVNFSLPNDIYYFVLEDSIPAETEAVNTRLLTTSDRVEGESFKRVHDDEYWNWGWWYIDRTELCDKQTNLYADFLPAKVVKTAA